MSAPVFDLTEEPWIPVLWADGTRGEVSLRRAFEQAVDIRTITGDLPTQQFALHRLLLAILHRALEGPRTTSEWSQVRDSWPQAVAQVGEYLDDFQDRFDLFHPSAPFYQVADLHTAKDEVFGLERIISDVPNGHPFFTTRAGAGLRSVTAAEAARWLVHAQAFDPSGIKSGAVGDPRVKGGKGYPIGVAWAGQLGGLELLGGTLRETLLLNLVASDVQGMQVTTGDADLPPWEREPHTESEEMPDRPPRGFVDLYTWQSRRVRLHGSADGVTGVVLCNGDRITPQNQHRFETMSAWRFSEPQTKKHGQVTYMPREHDPSRTFWRGLSALLPTAGDTAGGSTPAKSLPPAVLTWVGELHDQGLISSVTASRVHATGLVYGSNSSVVAELMDDVLTLPTELLAPGAEVLRATALDAVRHTEAAVDAVGNLARNLAAAAGAGTTDAYRDRARDTAYARLDAPFRRWLARLSGDEERSTALSRWHTLARSILQSEADTLISASGPAAWRGRPVSGRHVDVGQATVWFSKALFTALSLTGAERQETSA